MTRRLHPLWGLQLVWALLLAAAAPGAAQLLDPEAESTCITCHEQEDEELAVSVPEWRESVHALHEVSCDGCHGGDPREEDADLSMSEEAGFLDNPSWTEMTDYCGVCHEGIAASYRLGYLGRNLREGVRVATCATCHMADGHRIVESRPEEILTAERCPHCLGVDDPQSELARLHEVRALELATAAQVRAAGDKGMDVMGLDAGRRAAHASWMLSVHRFHDEFIEPALRVARAELAEVRSTAIEYERRADERRRYGAVVLGALGLLLVSLVLMRRASK